MLSVFEKKGTRQLLLGGTSLAEPFLSGLYYHIINCYLLN